MVGLRDLTETVVVLQAVFDADAMGGRRESWAPFVTRSAHVAWAAAPDARSGREDGGNRGVATVRYDSETAVIQAGQRLEVVSRVAGEAASRTYKISSVDPAGRSWIRLSFADVK
ncbi:hypothetical protein ABAC460_23050 [Asticcacaulis sp. AC460]|uniref:phage head completion protein n=1 Tax=Asticcacaulis sp. AC460 TaxID=1282360 RepID=UPI0003C3C20E|nr:head-tail adaptor protein [Asticcacaulis sp. AC460]ESQ86592.1 hypothetical protein ABAC460_23050 [Asticcacaulis sp. AC460]